MTTIIKTTKNDIDTGVDVKVSDNAYTSTKSAVMQALVAKGYDQDALPEEAYVELARDCVAQEVKAFNQVILDAEEIFIEEAAVSRWSGNMMDNSIIAIAGDGVKVNGYNVSLDVKVGVSRKAISTGNGRWTSRPAKRLRKNSTGVVYEYNGFKMHPGVDYSKYLDEGTAKIPNAAAWAGFVKRAEDRINAL